MANDSPGVTRSPSLVEILSTSRYTKLAGLVFNKKHGEPGCGPSGLVPGFLRRLIVEGVSTCRQMLLQLLPPCGTHLRYPGKARTRRRRGYVCVGVQQHGLDERVGVERHVTCPIVGRARCQAVAR
jgi:hypothetical protein